MAAANLFDHYSARARLQPALLAFLPAALGLISWTGVGVHWESALWALFGTAGGTFLLATLARNLGKNLESHLWKSWGGAPTTQLLRHSGPGNPVMKERWRDRLSKLLGKAFPSKEEEVANPAEADDLYAAAVRLLINQTRDSKKYPLVYKENVQYGFCRNLLGLKAVGLTLALISLLASLASVYYLSAPHDPRILSWVCTAVTAIFLVVWIFVVRKTWVRVPAFAYAERLLESSEDVQGALATPIRNSRKKNQTRGRTRGEQ